MDEQDGMKEAAKIKVLIVDDHPIMRVGIAAIIEATPDMTVVAQAGSGEEAVELFEKHLPDITLMDLRLPGISGVEAIRTCPGSPSQRQVRRAHHLRGRRGHPSGARKPARAATSSRECRTRR